jgi:Arc/MetJ-type ribon-helix-helix transcriptional regulator
MSKLDPIDEFVREQLASGRFSDYEALVRYALANLKDRQSEIDEIAEELRPAIESMQRGEPGLIVDFENIKQEGRKRLALTGRSE